LRCVFDTNVLVSALLLPASRPRQALDRAFRSGQVLLSFEALTELYEVLNRKQFRRYVSEEDVRTFIAALARETEWVQVDIEILVCRDPEDNKFLELAVTGRADYIVSGDNDLLTLNPFREIRILAPHTFLSDAPLQT